MRPLVLAVFFFLTLAPVALAVPLVGGTNTTDSTLVGGKNTGSPGGSVITLVNPLGEGVGLFGLLEKILQLVVRIGTIAIILMLVYIGYLFVVAQGNSTKIADARRALLWTVIGALILLGAQAISLGISATVQAIATGK